MKKLNVSLIVFMMLLVFGAGTAWSVVALPTLLMSGNIATKDGILHFNSNLITPPTHVSVSMLNYSDGTFCNSGCPADSIYGALVSISDAVRVSSTTDTITFTDAVISIDDPDGFNYMTADLSNVVFLSDGIKWYMNPGLDVCNAESYNLSNIVLDTDADHPSKFIDDFQETLDVNDISGMKLSFDILSGSPAGDGRFSIFSALVMGAPPVIEDAVIEVPRSAGYWKNNLSKSGCDFYSQDAISEYIDVLDIFGSDTELRYYLKLKGKKSMEQKALQQLAALLLNVAAGLEPDGLLTANQLALIQELDDSYGPDATVGDAVLEIENAIDTGDNLETAKDLAEDINTN